ncbi:MAG: PH domain-containing protein [Luteimonas sp.]
MTTPTPEPAAERRLHPWSWLFVLIAQLRQFILPLAALLFFGQHDEQALWPLIGIGVLALASVWQYFTYRYWIEGDSLVIRSGLLHRQVRQVPFARIHNVALHQTVLHRLFGVAEVRLESAGGDKPEAQMRVLRLSEAMALEQLVRRRASADVAPVAGEAPTLTLLQLPPMEVVRLGLVSNRGLIVLGGGAAAMAQFGRGWPTQLIEGIGKTMFGWADAHHFGPQQYLLVGTTLVLGFIALLRLFSMVLALLQYFGFRLDEQGRRLTVERGLLTRVRTSTPRRRIQAWTLEEGLLHRLLHRRSLHIDTAASGGRGQQRNLRELAPIATADTCDALVQHLLPGAAWPPSQWQPLHRLAWLRLAWIGILLTSVACAALCWRFGTWGLLLLAYLPWSVLIARKHAMHAGYSCDRHLVAVRSGWWSRHWRFAELDKLQALQLSRSPLDRCFGMATLALDTAGASALAPSLRLHYLPEAEARTLLQQLGEVVATRKLRW